MGVAEIDFSTLITPACRFVGSEEPGEPQIGDIYFNKETNEMLLYISNWELLAREELNSPAMIKKTRCTSCGASLPLHNIDSNGLCECTYCSRIEYVW